jgi:ArsR family transcriptional regulator, virulence genes transcriptional regulator
MQTIETTLNEDLKKQKLLKIDSLSIKKASLIFRSINHKLRQSILKLLAENDNLTVTDIYVKLRLEQSVASQHLAVLRKTGFVNTKRDGKNIYYSVNMAKIEYLQQSAEKLNDVIDK